MFLICVAIIAVMFLLFSKKKPGAISLPSISSPLSQRDADRKEALELIESKLIEADKQKRLAEAIGVISSLQIEAVDPAKKTK